jgi:uncharacterized protein YndB with AHSA1/START domain
MSNKRTVTAAPDAQSIAFSREFEAPAALVFRAHVDPELVARWTGPAGTSVTMRAWDARTGGSWSYVVGGTSERGTGGSWAFHGSFHEVTAPSRIVQTFEFEGNPGHANLESLTFVDLGDGRSRIDGLSTFQSVEDRDAMLADMDSGMDENFDRLEELLAGMRATA